MSKAATLRTLDKTDAALHAHFERWGQYSDEQLNRRPSDGGWSPVQVMHHLILAEGGSLEYLKKKKSRQSDIENLNLAARLRAIMLRFILALPIKVKAPKVVSEEMLPKRADFEESKQQWLAARAELRTFLQELPEEYFEKSFYKHPLIGKMSLKAMVQFFHSHVERHAKQVERALGEVKAAKAS
jgi:hypothetical protein